MGALKRTRRKKEEERKDESRDDVHATSSKRISWTRSRSRNDPLLIFFATDGIYTRQKGQDRTVPLDSENREMTKELGAVGLLIVILVNINKASA